METPKSWRSAFILAALALAPYNSLAAVVSAGDEIVLADTKLSQYSVCRAGNRFAVVLTVDDEANLPRLELRYIDPLSSTASAPVEITANGAEPSIASFQDGSLVVVWGDYSGWYAKFFDTSGMATTDPLPLPIGSPATVRIATGSAGNWVLLFDKFVEETTSYEVEALRFNGVVAMSPDPMFIDTHESWETRVAMNTTNDFLASWPVQKKDPGCDEDCSDYCCFDGDSQVLGRSFNAQAEPASDAHPLGDFRNDEQGVDGIDLVAEGSGGFVGAWLDKWYSDTDGPDYLVLRRLDAAGVGLAKSRVLATLRPYSFTPSLGVGAEQALLAICRSATEFSQLPYRIELFSTPLDAGPVESAVVNEGLDSELSESDPLVAVNESGAMLMVWRRWEYPVVSYKIVARSYVVAPSIVCGDANYDSGVSAIDSLGALRAAVGTRFCALPVCDANGDEGISATDAAKILRRAVGIDTEMLCPPTGNSEPPPFPIEWP